jgi:hypothetical protein
MVEGRWQAMGPVKKKTQVVGESQTHFVYPAVTVVGQVSFPDIPAQNAVLYARVWNRETEGVLLRSC